MCECSARDEERHRPQDLVFHVNERVLLQRDATVGLPLGIRFHRVATLVAIRYVVVLPEMDDAAQRSNMRDEEAVGFSEILALQRQRQPLVSFEKSSETVRFGGVCPKVENHPPGSLSEGSRL